MSAREEDKSLPKEYPVAGWAKGVWAVLSLLMLIIPVDVLLTEEVNWFEFNWFYMGVVGFLIPAAFLVSAYGRKMIVKEDGLENVTWGGAKSVEYAEMKEVYIESTQDAVDMYKSGGKWWPDFVVPYAVRDYRDVAREIVRRVPPETEVYDPLGVAEEVQQSERWEGRGREASTG